MRKKGSERPQTQGEMCLTSFLRWKPPFSIPGEFMSPRHLASPPRQRKSQDTSVKPQEIGSAVHYETVITIDSALRC